MCIRDREIVEFELAGQKSDLRTHFVGLFHDAVSVDERVALVGTDQRRQHSQRRGFTCAVGSQKSVNLSSLRFEGNPVYRNLFSERRLFYLPLLRRKTKRLFEVRGNQYVLFSFARKRDVYKRQPSLPLSAS